MEPSTHLTYTRAKRMRREPTAAEQKLWGALRKKSLAGLKFQRQVPIGRYIVDFINHERGIVIELDGATHSEDFEIARDRQRTRHLESIGLHVCRINNDDVYHQLSDVLQHIHDVVMSRPVVPTHQRHWLPQKG